MRTYKLANIIGGWSVFLVAAVVYLMTIEPTVSFWDCGEFIAASYKLEVGHPPGAPFFLILGRFFSLFAGDPGRVPVMINVISALASAFTILFMFWTITHLAGKIFLRGDLPGQNNPEKSKTLNKANSRKISTGKILAVIGSGLVGALAYTFSDTFWFSAVEGEVYATSSFFTAFVFWAILKWENHPEQKHANRWIILIAFIMGISLGIHLLNLLTIPAIVFVCYFKKYKVSTRGILGAALVSVLLMFVILYIIIPGVVQVASIFELFFVNVAGMPYNSGVVIFVLLLTILLVWGVWNSHRRQKILLNHILLGLSVIIIGYFSYASILIRSLADPPMDQNDPETVFSLLSYLNREQYGQNPLLHGPYYNAPMLRTEPGKKVYTKEDGKYKVTYRRPEIIYDERFLTFFPRMWSTQPDHIEAYKEWGRVDGIPLRVETGRGEPEMRKKPTFGENLRFFFRYQVGHMYLRYFMWNFAGRQNDIQGHGEFYKGNWISGINFIDEARLGSQDRLPPYLAENPARNKYYMLPLLLGLIGVFYHYKRKNKDFWVVTLLFVMTGLAIMVYLNQYPFQPRERDYAYAGSFYAFSIWIGLGVMALADWLAKKLPLRLSAILATVLCLGLVPVNMAAENWDDHDRSGRYTARDFARNYLNSCEENAILFTNGDNDTFPLWYAQEVEGIRTDVRVVNLSYLGAPWYIEQMQRKAYDSDPVPFGMEKEKYRLGTRDVVYLFDRIKEHVDLKQAMDFLASDNPRTKTLGNIPERINYLPSKKFKLTIDKEKILETGTVRPEMADQIVEEMQFRITRNNIMRNDMMVLDLLANFNWGRPVYYAITVGRENYLNLQNYFQIQGLAYRVVPVYTEPDRGMLGSIDTEIMYDNMINKFRWGNIQDPDVYLDDNILRMVSNFRNNFGRLAEALINEGKLESAKRVLDKSMEVMPPERIPYNFFMLPIMECYYRVGETERANEMAGEFRQVIGKELDYFLNADSRFSSEADYEKQIRMHILQEIARITAEYGQEELSQKVNDQFQQYMMMYSPGIQR